MIKNMFLNSRRLGFLDTSREYEGADVADPLGLQSVGASRNATTMVLDGLYNSGIGYLKWTSK